MACRRSLSTTSTLIRKRLHPSSSHILQNKDDDSKSHSPSLSPRPSINGILPRGPHNRTTVFGALHRGRTCSTFFLPMGLGSSFCRYMSTTIGDDSDKIDGIGYIAEVVADKAVQAVGSQVPAVSEVAIAAADSYAPVAALQYLIDWVHSFTGLNWWASIALTTILIRGATVPLLIHQLKTTSKFSLMRPRLEELNKELKESEQDPDAMSKYKEGMSAIFKEYGVTPFTPLKGMLVQGPIFISFFLAIRAMAEKVPSFQSGGALWFVDLSTPDSLFILPLLTSLTFWITVECNMQEGLENNPVAGKMKNFSRIVAVVSVPVMAAFPKALFCYWLTSNLFSLAYGSVVKRPEVKSFLAIPQVPMTPPMTSSALEQNVKDKEPSLPTNPSNDTGSRISSSSSMIRQRLRTLEKHVNGRKDNKKK